MIDHNNLEEFADPRNYDIEDNNWQITLIGYGQSPWSNWSNRKRVAVVGKLIDDQFLQKEKNEHCCHRDNNRLTVGTRSCCLVHFTMVEKVNGLQ